jgi:glycosyltransferase involved in cell wall biosynthesis
MNIKPIISVIIPAYNCEKYIAETLHSILAQTLSPDEIIVVDDGSIDRTAEVVQALADKHPQIFLIRQSNAGQSAARNRAITQAKGEVLALLDGDDRWLPTYLEKMVRPAVKNGVAHCDYQYIDRDGKVLVAHNRVRSAEVKLPWIITSNYFCANFVTTRETWDKTGPFDSEVNGLEDWDWITRALLAGIKPAFVSEPLWQYRRHGSNISRNAVRISTSNTRRLEKIFARPDLPEFCRAQKAEAYLVNHALSAGLFLLQRDMSSVKRHLQEAYRHAPHLYNSPQTFISYLKIFAINGGDLLQQDETLLTPTVEACAAPQERKCLAATGSFTLGLLLFRRKPKIALRLAISALRIDPLLIFRKGMRFTLARYGRIYSAEFLTRLRLRFLKKA